MVWGSEYSNRYDRCDTESTKRDQVYCPTGNFMNTLYKKAFHRAYDVLQKVHEDLGWAMDDLPYHDDLASARGLIEDFNEDDVPESFDPDEKGNPESNAWKLLDRMNDRDDVPTAHVMTSDGETWQVAPAGGAIRHIAGQGPTPEAAIRNAWENLQNEGVAS